MAEPPDYLVVMGEEIRGPMTLTAALALVRADPHHRFIHWAQWHAAMQKRPSAAGVWQTDPSLARAGVGESEGGE
jgi:hypothetical protein